VRLVFEQNGTGRTVFNHKIEAKHAMPRVVGQRRHKVSVSKTGRLIEIQFACAAKVAGRGYLTFTESEIFLLAKLCRRNRTDDELLRAIGDAGEGLGEIRRTRRTRRDLVTEDSTT
jgi:hypothetical protein